MATRTKHSLRPAFELVRKIQYSNGKCAQWGPAYFSEDKNEIIRQMWGDLEELSQQHVDSAQPFKMSFEVGDNPTASFTFHETAEHTNTITWRIENRTKIVA